ncbi:MAG: ATP synthase subunit I [Pseudomonadota bacterium]
MHKFPIYRAIASQSLVWLTMVVVVTLALGLVSGYSTALGGLISLIPGSYFMVRYFRHSGARAMEQVLRSAFIAELGKIAQMCLGFALVFTLVKPLNPLAVMGGFLIVQVAGMLIAARLGSRKPG